MQLTLVSSKARPRNLILKFLLTNMIKFFVKKSLQIFYQQLFSLFCKPERSVIMTKLDPEFFPISFVEITHQSTNETSRFEFKNQPITPNGVLARKAVTPFSGSVNPQLLTAAPDLSIKSRFIGHVFTSDKFGAGTDAKGTVRKH